MQARRLPARHGFLWLLGRFRVFRANPPLMTALTVSYLFLVILLNVLPLLGPIIAPLALPALSVILANGCRAISNGGGTGSVRLLYGLKPMRFELLRLGGLHLLGSLFILILSSLLDTGAPSVMSEDAEVDREQMLLEMGKLLLIGLPVVAAFWFAPLLTAWNGISAPKAVFFSIVAVWRNWQSFLGFCLSIALVAVVLPLLIMLAAGAISPVLLSGVSLALKMALVFVLLPTLMASVYVSYEDVFHGAEPA